MGIKGGLKQYLGGRPIANFLKFDCGMMMKVDAANLLFNCLLKQPKQSIEGDYRNALSHFQQFLDTVKFLEANVQLVFDGMPYSQKKYENERRAAKGIKAKELLDEAIEKGLDIKDSYYTNQLKNTSIYIAAAAHLCKQSDVDFVVAFEEADTQLSGTPDMAANTIVVSADHDMLALGVRKWISVENWWTQEALFVDLDAMQPGPGTHRFMSLIMKHRQQQQLAFILCAALLGCDFTANPTGCFGVGIETVCDFFVQVCPGELSIVGLSMMCFPQDHESQMDLLSSLNYVHSAFKTMAHFYDNEGRIVCVDGTVRCEPTDESIAHMKGNLDPKSRTQFDENTIQLIASIDKWLEPPLDKDHNTCAHLRKFIAYHGGSVPATMRKQEMIVLANKFREFQEQVPLSKPFRRGFSMEGVPKRGDTPVATILESLIRSKELSKLPKILDLLKEVHANIACGNYLSNFHDITRHRPQQDVKLIEDFFKGVSTNPNSKCFKYSFQKGAEKDKIYLHNLILLDGRAFIVSKQPASMNKDESTRSKTEAGEKPEPELNLVVLELEIVPTNIEEHGHELGLVKKVTRWWCQCTAGQGECVHAGTALWDNYHHHDETRAEQIPSTISLQGWGHGAKKRCTTNTTSIHNVTIENIDRAKPDKAYRSCRLSDAASHGGDIEYLAKEDEDLVRSRLCATCNVVRLFYENLRLNRVQNEANEEADF